jgi:hypothetical protein
VESLTDAGLTVTYDEESGVITFDWDSETHPEYDCLEELTSEQLCSMMFEHLNFCEEDHSSDTEIDGKDHTNL